MHPMDAWMNAIPDDVYAPCPCGCGKSFRYVVKGGEDALKEHAENFFRKFEAEKAGRQAGEQREGRDEGGPGGEEIG